MRDQSVGMCMVLDVEAVCFSKKEGKSAGLSERSSSTPLGIASHKGYQP